MTAQQPDNSGQGIRTEFLQAANSLMWTKTVASAAKGFIIGPATLLALDLTILNITSDPQGLVYPLAFVFGAAIGGAHGLRRGAQEKEEIIRSELKRMSTPPGPV